MAKKKKPLRLLKHLLLLRLLKHLLLLYLLLNQQNSNALRQGRYTCGDQQKTALGRFFFVCASQFLGMGNAVL